MTAVPDLSVVIPARNEAAFIGPCIRSLQTVATEVDGLEIILVDNGSTDRTAAIAAELGARVVPVPTGSLGALRNLGAGAARGRFLAFVDADCTVDPGWARHAVRTLTEGAVATGSYPGLPDGDQSWVQRTWSYMARRPLTEPRPVSWLPTANLAVERQCFHRIGGFDESMPTAEDADLCYRLGRLGPIIYDDRVSARHHREPRTLRQFFAKEIWHGSGSYTGIGNGRLTAAEIPSLAAPLTVWAGWIACVAGIVAWSAGRGPTLLGVGVALTLGVPLAYTCRKLLGSPAPSGAGATRVLVLYGAYHFARAVSLLQCLREALSRRSPSDRVTTQTR